MKKAVTRWLVIEKLQRSDESSILLEPADENRFI